MKEFERWWKSYSKIVFKNECSYERKYGKIGWKAALGWVQSRLKFGSEVAYSEADILMAVKKEIREELEK